MSQHYSVFMRWTSRLMIVCTINFGMPSTSFASMVETDTVMSQGSVEQGRIKILSLIQREDLRSQLLSRGVTVRQAELRVKAMTDNEVLHISAELDRLPAGGDVLSSVLFVAGFIFLVKLMSGDFDDSSSDTTAYDSSSNSKNETEEDANYTYYRELIHECTALFAEAFAANINDGVYRLDRESLLSLRDALFKTEQARADYEEDCSEGMYAKAAERIHYSQYAQSFGGFVDDFKEAHELFYEAAQCTD